MNTEYLTTEIINATATSTVQLVVATATAAANGQSVGDVSIILSEGLAAALQASVQSAVQGCKIPGLKMSRRDAASDCKSLLPSSYLKTLFLTSYSLVAVCLAQAGATASTDGGLFEDFVASEVWETIDVTIAEGTEALIKATIASLSSIETTKLIVWLAAAAAATAIVYDATELNDVPLSAGPIGKINIPAAGLGAQPAVDGTNTCKTQPVKNVNSVSTVNLRVLKTLTTSSLYV